MSEMSAAPVLPQVYEFGDFRLDAAHRVLSRRDGAPVPLTPRVFDTLLFLVQHAQTVLDKERLMEAVWPDSIVEENNLSQNISTLRRVLGEKAGANRYIATVPGRGYRFVADVTALELGEPDAAIALPAHPTPPAAREQPSVRRSFRRGLIAVAGIAIIAALVLFIWPDRNPEASQAPPQEKGIAVLPFENLSADADDSFFAQGIQDDLLTSIGKIHDLKVIGRASVMDYQGQRLAGNVREIGRALGVSHVMEGSVRRAGDRVVVRVALLDTRDERQVWSERYERSLTDTLSLQGELAVEIARALRATVNSAENANLSLKPTAEPEAYLLYLRGRNIDLQKTEDWERAAQFYEQAVARDPSFALAHARLAILASELSRNEGTAPGWAEKARTHSADAARLQPELGEGHLALTYYYLFVAPDRERAAAALARATELLPNSAEVFLTAAFLHKLENRYRDRVAALRRAEALDPRSVRVLSVLARTQRWLRDWPGALQTAERIAVVRSDAAAAARLAWVRANDEFRLSADIDVLKRALASEQHTPSPLPPDSLARSRFEIAMLERDHAAAESALADFAPAASYVSLSPHTKLFHQALVRVARSDDPAAAGEALTAAATELEQILANGPRPGVRAALLHSDLAVLYALLGRKEHAISSAQRAIDLEPVVEGSVENNARAAALALVYARTGEADKALDLIEHLLTVPSELQAGEIYNLTLTDLKWRWIWDPLREHPRFQKLLAGPEPTTVY